MANNPSLVATVAAHLYRGTKFASGDIESERPEDERVSLSVSLAIKIVNEAERQLSESAPEWKAIP